MQRQVAVVVEIADLIVIFPGDSSRRDIIIDPYSLPAIDVRIAPVDVGARPKKALQCKDIPDRPILEFLDRLQGTWANWNYSDSPYNVRLAMPPDLPDKLVLAKMKQLMHRGLVEGCDCGCRGDFIITRKGVDWLNAPANQYRPPQGPPAGRDRPA